MTDKQIIIDGVDVSGCRCIIEDYQRANNFEGRYEHIKNVCELGERGAEYYNLFCKDNRNCYYKQLKRKEQECEELKNIINEAKNSKLDLNSFFAIEATVGEYQLELDQLKAENEELKKQVDDLLHKPEIQDKIIWKIDNEALLGSKDAYIYKLEKTLTEIKEIAERDKEFCIKCNGNKEIDCVDCIEGGRALLAKDILQKISESEQQ